jgi:FixJ family two-component response regulator
MQPKIGLRPFPAPGDERRTLAACRETPRQGDDDGPALALQKRSGRVAEAPVISVIDDDPSVRTATARLLRSMGFSVYAFASAQEFLSSPQLNETSCVIADVQMPGMNGVELQEYLTAQDHGVPIIFITAFPHEPVRERAMRGGAVCFLSKPFDEPQLLECVERALS